MMSYAVNQAAVTKVKAMRAKLLSPQDYEGAKGGGGLEADLAKICMYVEKPLRDYLRGEFVPALQAAKIPAAPAKDKSLTRVFGVETDLRNILWMYRLKKFHSVHGDGIFGFLNPKTHRLTSEEIARLAHAKDLQSFSDMVAMGFYRNVFAEGFAFAEQKITREIRRQYRREGGGLAIICGYLFARHLEEKNLQAIAKGMAGGLSLREIFPQLHI